MVARSDLREGVLRHEPSRPATRWLAVELLCALASGCARVALPPVAPIPSLPSAPLPPAPPPPEVARLQLPPWLTLEAVYGTSHDIHHRFLADAAFTRDGRSLVTLASDGGLRVWDLVARVLRAEVGVCVAERPPGRFGGARKLALSRDGLAAFGFGSGRVCVVELEGYRLVRTIAAHDAHVVALTFRDGVLWSYGYQEEVVMEAKTRPIVEQREAGGQARWWDPRTGARQGELVVGPQEAVALSSDGAWLATGRAQWDMRAGKPGKSLGLWRRDGRVRSVAVAAEHVAVTRAGEMLFAYQDDGLRIWSGESDGGRRFETANGGAEPKQIVALALSDDGRFAATLSDNGATLILWDVRTRREIHRRSLAEQRKPSLWARRVVFSSDGSMIATSGEADVAVWATRGLGPVIPVEHGALVGTLQPDGRHVLPQPRKQASLLDLTTGEALWRWPVREGAVVSLLAGGQRFLETYWDETKVRDVATGRTLWTAKHALAGPSRSVLVSPDGTRIAFDAGGPRMHDAADGRVLWQGQPANLLAFSADGRTLYVETRDWHVRALATTDGAVQADLDRKRTSTNSFYSTADGKRAIAVDYRQSTGYDLTTGKKLWDMEGVPYGIFFLPGHQTFVSHDNGIRLRSVATGQDVGPQLDLRPLGPVLVSPLLLPDGKTLLVGTNEGLVLRFHVAR
jgi:WD40 repeat protein